MARSDTTRKNAGIGEERDFGRVGLDVVHPTNVVAEQRNPNGILAFLGQANEMRQRERAERIAEAKSLAREEGQRDASTGRVDETRMADDEIYAEGVQANRAISSGIEMLSKSAEDLDLALKEDPNLDYEAWAQAWKRDYIGAQEATTTAAVKEQNRILAQFDQVARSRFEAKRTELKIKEAETSVADGVLKLMSAAGNKLTPEAFNAHTAALANNAGLDDDEAQRIVGSALLTELGTKNNLNAYELAKSRGLLESAEWAARFEKEREAAQGRIEAEQIEARRKDVEARLKADEWGLREAHAGRHTIANLTARVQRGELLQEEADRYWNTQLQVQQQRREEAARKLEAAQYQTNVAKFVNGGQEAVEFAIATKQIKRSDAQDYVDAQWAQAWAMTATDDPEVRKQGLEQMRSVLTTAQGAAIIPSAAKNILNEADLGNPQRFTRNASAYRDMVAAGMGDFIKNNVNSQAYAKLERWKRLVEDGGMTPIEATRQMNAGIVPPEEAEKRVSSVYRYLVNPAGQELAADKNIRVPGHVSGVLKNYMVAHVMAGEDEATALESAKRQFEDRFNVIDGFPVPKAWTQGPRGDNGEYLDEVWPTYRDEILLPSMRERYGDEFGDTVNLIPSPHHPGKFMVARPNSVDVLYEDGAVKVYDINELIRETALHKRTKAEKEAQREVAEKTQRDTEALNMIEARRQQLNMQPATPEEILRARTEQERKR